MKASDPALRERLRMLIADIAELPDWFGTPPTDIHSRNALGDTPLHVAAVRGDVQGIADLISAGADLNVKGEHGFTPLHEAVSQRHHEVVRLLLAAGATRTEPNDWGQAPADTARLQNDDIMLALLQ
jgi:ankyrin repeat protein